MKKYISLITFLFFISSSFALFNVKDKIKENFANRTGQQRMKE